MATELRREGSYLGETLQAGELRHRAPARGGSQPAVRLTSTSGPGATGRRFRASSCSCRDHTYAGGIDQHAATGVFTARPSRQDLVERLGQVMAAGQFGELFAHIDLSRCGQTPSRANRDIGALAVWSTGDPSSSDFGAQR